ncbi:DUF485 domain-containing protein [Pseudonocardia kujensis]|uniref:DUF485 domain-containing protein n=1 Tax=Pseudonocardia kujensis TaxID=1128675 RepID=UPI001E37DF53|nr:DUF485 domain-containing protein [Pseudonocardia kujensis]MCE0768206.1 DUF485 domain-containing protein [Pseudonocardia kujensis]
MTDHAEPPSPAPDTPSDHARRRAAAVTATPAFAQLVHSRNRFAVPAAALGFGAYLLVIVLSGFTPVLNGKAVGQLSWTFVLTALIFPLVWLLCGLYTRRAAQWDELADRAIAESGVEARATAPTAEKGL